MSVNAKPASGPSLGAASLIWEILVGTEKKGPVSPWQLGCGQSLVSIETDPLAAIVGVLRPFHWKRCEPLQPELIRR